MFLTPYHVDGDAVPLLDALGLEDVGELADLLVELRVRDLALVPRVVALPEEGRLRSALLEVPIEAVVREVRLGVLHPLHVDLALKEGVCETFKSKLKIMLANRRDVNVVLLP